MSNRKGIALPTSRILPATRSPVTFRAVFSRLILGCGAFVFLTTPAAAELVGRNLDGTSGSAEAYYDTDLDITWLAHFNVAGRAMKWNEAMTFASGFELGGYSNWRMPKTFAAGWDGTCNYASGGTSICGYLPPENSSELIHLYNVTLGNIGLPTDGWGLKNTGPFLNLPVGTGVFWSETQSNASNAWVVGMQVGDQGPNSKTSYNNYVALVHTGDIGSLVTSTLLATGDVTDSTLGLFIPPVPGFKILGNAGTGKIEVSGQPRAASIPYAFLGLNPTGDGELLVRDNSDLAIAPVTFANASLSGEDVVETALFIGTTGHGELNVIEGSTVSGARYVQVGFFPGGSGDVLVDGTGSEFNISGRVAKRYAGFLTNNFVEENTQGILGIGAGGNGTLTIANGGTVNVTEIANEPVLQGRFGVAVGGNEDLSGGTGLLTIDGAGSTLNILGKHALLLIGGVGPDAATLGTTNIAGNGEVIVRNGGKVNMRSVGESTNLAVVGNGGDGKLSVTGTDSAFNMTGNFSQIYVGLKNSDMPTTQGKIEVTDGGKVTVTSSNNGNTLEQSFISLGVFAGGHGELLVDGPGSVVDAGEFLTASVNVTLNDFFQDPGDILPDKAVGTGIITVRNGGRIEADLGTFIGIGGLLQGNGTVVGGVFASTGGIISPGTSPGDLTVIGDVNLNFGGTLNLEICSASIFDRILTTGLFQLGGGHVNFIFGDGVDPLALALFDIGDFLRAIPVEGDPSTPASPLGLDSVRFTGQALGFNIQSIAFDATTGFQVERTVVPLPGALPLMAGALGFLGWRRRRVSLSRAVA